MNQTQAFRDSLGDAYFRRNKTKLGLEDHITTAIDRAGIKPKGVVEIGCANGWRLERLQRKYGCYVYGIDPSREAILDGQKSDRPWLSVGTADKLWFADGGFDMLIFGFCLYLCEPQEWFKIVCEADRVLADGGHLIIHDFAVARPHRIKLQDGVGYAFDHRKLWLAHPSYKLIADSTIYPDHQDGRHTIESVSIMQKNHLALFTEETGNDTYWVTSDMEMQDASANATDAR
jgi:SAM-dependent methyltransferase